MENLISILIVVACVLGILKLFVFKRKRSFIKRGVIQLKIISILLVTGMFWCPLTLLYCVRNPEKAVIYGAKMGLVALRVKGDVKRTVKGLDDGLNSALRPYTPSIGKQVVNTAKKSYDRYGIRDTQRFVAGTGSQVGVTIYKPQPSLFEKVGKGISNTVKVICSPIRQVFGFLGL